jgi:16S rRNA (guanine527-N7)-methyltransferase
MNIDLLKKYFPLNEQQARLFEQATELYLDWNAKINVISRKDSEFLVERHILHALAIAKFIQFKPQTHILDVGTGGGFPGIPLAIMFPDVQFTLIDGIAKKIKVVSEVSQALDLKNVEAKAGRAEELKTKYDFVVSRAVTSFPAFVNFVNGKFKTHGINGLPNGIIYLKGGDFSDELKPFKKNAQVFDLSDYFTEEFFETKKIIYLPM